MHFGFRLLSALTVSAVLGIASRGVAQVPPPPVSVPQIASTGKTLPLLSVDNLQFLEGTWSAVSRDGQQVLGSYTFARVLNGHVLVRTSVVGPGCDPARVPACSRKDLFYVYQDSPGAPLSALSLDGAGQVIHYLVSQQTEAAVSGQGRRYAVIFDSDPAQFGPRVRLHYDLNRDLQSGKESMSGAFEILQADGTFRAVQQWFGTRQ